MTSRIKKARKQQELDELVFNVLASFRHQGAMQWTDWYETTTARRERGLSTRTFSEVVKRLVASRRVQKDKDDCYRIITTAADFPTIDTDQCWKALLKAGNGNDADIADIALQQLMDREVQDS